MKKKAVLIIIDGFGEGEKNNKNAIFLAKTPYIDYLKKNYPFSLIKSGGEYVGVLPGQKGGSDIGHNTIGSGRVVRQPIKIIYDAIQDKSFFTNKKLLEAINHTKKNNSKLHLFGIGSDSFVHSHTSFIYALLDLCKQNNLREDQVFLHLAADGRDNPPFSGLDFFTKIEEKTKKIGLGKIVSIFGRFYLDRGKNWDRTEKLYQMLTTNSFQTALTYQEYFKENYQKNIGDEFLEPKSLKTNFNSRIEDNDTVINFCYRADRERQITQALVSDDFLGFKREKINNLYYLGFIKYLDKEPKLNYVFDEEQADICLSEILDQNNFTHTHLAGREKIIFVTYNLNRCQNLNLKTEKDIEVPQTKEVETFDKNPEMSTPNLTKVFLEELEKNNSDVFIINYENCDQVGHTGDLEATIKAVESVDKSLSVIIPKALEKNYEILITADHGNADLMINGKGEKQTSHSDNPVPLIYVSKNNNKKLKEGSLQDITPTFLDILGLEKDQKMTGKTLIEFREGF
jgi:2,3-bisphosphoglycerate-independent phosphoglycerate mutase